MSTLKSKLVCASVLLLTGACSSSNNNGSTTQPSGNGGASSAGTDGGSSADSGTGAPDTSCPVVVKESDCDPTIRPFVFVHGTYGSGDNFAHVAALLGSNGYCQDQIVGVEYNSLGDQPGSNGAIDKVVDDILAKTGATQVDLAGHSQGTAHCGTYLSDPTHAAKVAHYINFSGSPAVGYVATLSLSSQHDLGMTPHHATGNNVKTVTFEHQDHFAVAASTDSFVEVYKYLQGKDPQYTTVQCGEPEITIAGIAESFADNVPQLGSLEIRVMTDTPRQDTAPLLKLDAPDSTGHFGPIKLKRNVAYEIKGFDASGTLIGYQYFTPFKRSNYLVRLLTPSANSLIASASTDRWIRGPNHTAIVFRWAGGAFRQDLGASLKIDGNEILTDGNAGAGAFSVANLNGGVVAIFSSDGNLNKKSDLTLYDNGPFLAFTDVYIPDDSPKLVDIEFTPGSEEPAVSNTHVKVSNWPSDQAQILVMFQ